MGESLLEDAESIADDDAFGAWVRKTERWHALGKEALHSSYASDKEGDEFFAAATGRIFTVFGQTVDEEFANRKRATSAGLNTLRSLLERLQFAEEPTQKSGGITQDPVQREIAIAQSDLPPQHLDDDSHRWAIANTRFLNIVFEAFDREADWPPLHDLQQELAQAGDRIDLGGIAVTLPPSLGQRDGGPEERIRLSVFGLRYVDDAAVLLNDFMRVVRLAVERYLTPGKQGRLSRADLTETLGMTDERATKLSRIILQGGARFLGGGASDVDTWDQVIAKPAMRSILDANSIDDYLEAEARIRGYRRESGGAIHCVDSTPTIFVAYPYSISKEDYRGSLSEVEEAFSLEFLYADEEITSSTFSRRLRE
jgi:hypothetical protein